jgi:hypothetical protein
VALVIHRRLVPLAAALALVLVLASPGAAGARVYAIPAALGSAIDDVREVTGLDIFLPSSLNLDYGGATYASGVGRQNSYSIGLAGAPNCGGSTACFLADFSARKGTHSFYTRKVKLRGGRTGYYKPLSCGASCSPPAIEWVTHGTVYSIQAKVASSKSLGARARLIRAANSAIIAGPR